MASSGRVATALLTVCALIAAAGCATGGPEPPASGRVRVVASINAWGSVLSQLGGTRVEATSIIANPNTDPHGYEPTPADARKIADARLVVINGAGYDAWATRTVAADPDSGRIVIDVGDLVGVADGGNPHRWYAPSDIETVADRITSSLTTLDPADAAYFDQQRATFEQQKLARYHSLIDQIRTTYAGTPVGASESVAAPLTAALGLDLLTPPGFLAAISAGADPSAADKATIDRQIADHQIKVYVFNSQNSTPDVQTQVAAARAAGVPVVPITETLTPATASFQDWQSAQLQALADALHQATGR